MGGWTRVTKEDLHLRLEIRTEFDSPSLRAALTEVCGEDRVEELPRLAEGRRSLVGKLQSDGLTLALKRYTFPRAFVLRTFAHRSRAEREAAALTDVEEAVPNDVRVVAWGEVRRGGFVPRCWLATTLLEDSCDLRTLKNLPQAERDALATAILRDLPPRVAALHDARVFARDLRGKNILYQRTSGRFAFIDLPRAGRGEPLSLRRRAHDLACLSIELRRSLEDSEWERFLSGYLEAAAELGPADRDALTELVEAEALRVGKKTPVRRWVRAAKRRFRRSGLGRLVTGTSYQEA